MDDLLYNPGNSSREVGPVLPERGDELAGEVVQRLYRPLAVAGYLGRVLLAVRLAEFLYAIR